MTERLLSTKRRFALCAQAAANRDICWDTAPPNAGNASVRRREGKSVRIRVHIEDHSLAFEKRLDSFWPKRREMNESVLVRNEARRLVKHVNLPVLRRVDAIAPFPAFDLNQANSRTPAYSENVPRTNPRRSGTPSRHIYELNADHSKDR
ncbi:hypothetical protein V4C53_03995 [Paraburkholderia azotifigens]|uniref:hypothetical protein n=1 Tax=Paraburkholderia azotifigens TaxID=2057004 RepID=UPI00316FA54B